ncbi:ImmA/IrrE family metallo-endopeptidase [Dermatophilaceae bacterium Sec6.4]
MSPESEGQARAEQFRHEKHLGLQPIGDAFALFELVPQLDVASLAVSNPDEHGMTAHDPARGVTKVVVACTQNPLRQRSTLAHELAHVLFRDHEYASQGKLTGREDYEQRADAFARHLLVPLQGLRDFLGPQEPLSTADLSRLVQWFVASPQMMLIQLARAAYIDQARKDLWWNHTGPWLAGNHGWMPQYRALQVESATPRAPQRLLTRATHGYQDGVLSLRAIARIRAADPKFVERELAQAGITPSNPALRWADTSEQTVTEHDFADLDALEDIEISLAHGEATENDSDETRRAGRDNPLASA